MKITSNPPINIGKLYQAHQTQSAATSKKAGDNVSGNDNLHISEQARKIHELIKEAKDLPEIREEKIAKLKEQINNNTYNISPAQLAAKMLSEENK